MHFLKTLPLASLALTASACKCVRDGTNEVDATAKCCDFKKGIMDGDDCAADSISEKLSGFRKCCAGEDEKLTSDCDFPGKKDEGSAAIQKRAPRIREISTAGAIVTVVA